MNQEKYIGMDVHQATISVAVMDCQGKLIMECVLETKAATILEFIHGLRGSLSVTLEEGTMAQTVFLQCPPNGKVWCGGNKGIQALTCLFPRNSNIRQALPFNERESWMFRNTVS
jgi:hypothetical protein